MYSLGGVWRPPPRKKAFKNRCRVETHVHSRIFQGQLIKKIRPITLIVWVLGRVKRWLKIRKKNIFFVLNKYQNVTHVSTCIFQVVLDL